MKNFILTRDEYVFLFQFLSIIKRKRSLTKRISSNNEAVAFKSELPLILTLKGKWRQLLLWIVKKSYMWTSNKKVIIRAIFAVMNTTYAVAKITPENYFH